VSARVVISCEHASAAVPARYEPLFRGAGTALRSHRGSDLGARMLARRLARKLGSPLVEARATRLLADPNRSLGHRHLFSEWTRKLDGDERERILSRFWRPHREAVERAVRKLARGRGAVAHISVHTFAPVWNGKPREVDVGLLYDPRRARERSFASSWLAAVAGLRSDLSLRRNHPYRGSADGLTTHLRRVFEPTDYLGIELEVSQRHPLGPAPAWHRLQDELGQALETALESVDRE